MGEEDGVIPVSDSGIGTNSRNHWESDGIPRNSGIGTNSRNSGIAGNWKEFRGIPELEPIPGIPESLGIGRNSAEFRNSVPKLDRVQMK